ncbi:MAG: DUF6429 family protein [Candidatus Woesearchaeota archaeon]
MENEIKELTHLLLYLTSWEEEDVLSEKVIRSWKGYPFDILNELNDEGLIYGSKKAKSVYFTEDGIEKAKELIKKYLDQEA